MANIDPGKSKGEASFFQTLLRWQQSYKQKVTDNPKIKLFTRAMWLVSISWAIYLCWQSIPFYTHMAKGKAFFQAGQYAPAESEYTAALAQAESFHQQDPRIAAVLNNLAQLYQTEARYTKAEETYDRLLSIMNHAWWHKEVGLEIIHNNKAALFLTEGRYADAVSEYNLALTYCKENDANKISILNGLANALREQGKYKQAEEFCRQALLLCNNGGTYDPRVAMVLDSLGRVFLETGKYTEAQTAFTQALNVDMKTVGKGHPDVAKDFNNLGELYLAEGDCTRAAPYLQNALAIRRAVFGAKHPQTARTISDLGQCELQSGNLEDASKLLNSALKAREESLGPEHPDVATTLDQLALLSMKERHIAEARQLIDRSIKIKNKTRGSSHPEYARSVDIRAQIDKSAQ